MARTREVFICTACGSSHARWMGKCPDCGAWDSLESHRVDKQAGRDPHLEMAGGAAEAPRAVPITEIDRCGQEARRFATGISELDRVLGGGLVPGSAVLVGGSPGIGKSTLLLQAAGALALAGSRALYVSSEESARQIGLRATRLGLTTVVPADGGDTGPRPGASADAPRPSVAGVANLFILPDTNLARIVEQTRKVNPDVLVVDSVQMVYRSDLDAAPGSITQLRRCASDLVYLAKTTGVAVVLVGHVTKDGQLAGPRLLEHLVDSVLYFEGDRYHAHRIIRSIKNRFGTTLEIGIFEMTGAGLRQVPEGASVSAVAGSAEARPGSVVCPVMTGSRCVLVEIQALTATGFLGAPKRKSSGLDSNRLAMIIAVLEQHAGLRLADRDVFASAVGGIRVAEPASDLALALAIAGAHGRRAIQPATAAVGEVGLGGEVRPVANMEARAREAARLGYRRLIVPRGTRLDGTKIDTACVRNIDGAIEELA